VGKDTLQCFQSAAALQSKCTRQRSALPWLLSSRREVLLPTFPPDAPEAGWRGRGAFLPAPPSPPKRLSDTGRLCDLSEEEPAAYLPRPSTNTQPLQVPKAAAVRQTPRGPRPDETHSASRTEWDRDGEPRECPADAGKQQRGQQVRGNRELCHAEQFHEQALFKRKETKQNQQLESCKMG